MATSGKKRRSLGRFAKYWRWTRILGCLTVNIRDQSEPGKIHGSIDLLHRLLMGLCRVL